MTGEGVQEWRKCEQSLRPDWTTARLAYGLIGLRADWDCFVDFDLAVGAEAEVRVVR